MAQNLKIGAKAPDFNLPGDSGGSVDLSAHAGKSVIVYFYPKDLTPGCTTQALDFTAMKQEFDDCNAEIIGISADPAARHDAFKAKHGLAITLGADEQLDTIKAYGVWVEKNMYGRKYMGIERATFLIDADGNISHIWRKVRVKNHVTEVLEAARTLAAAR
jgi:thioredoxin-dependent peroxiredoxin